MNKITNGAVETHDLGRQVAEKLEPGDIVGLYGDLGSGKTTFLQGVLEGLGISERVTSPTFTLLKMYITPGQTQVFHFDLYRVETEQALKEVGFTDFLEQGNSLIFIEWPKLAEHLLPEKTIHINFEKISDNERKIESDAIDL